jgi:hypothetical protein
MRTERGDWAGVSGYMRGLHQQGRAEDLSHAANTVARTQGAQRLLAEVTRNDPDDMLAHTLAAENLVFEAWEIRTSARAEHVSREQFAGFHRCLRQAEQLLIRITARQPDNLLAWKTRLNTARGLQLGQNEARRRYDRLAEHHPQYFPAQATFLQQLCPKWGGNWDTAFAFARECANQGGLGPAVLAEAHLERWADLGVREGRSHLAGAHGELVQAARQTALDPAMPSRFYTAYLHNLFAMLFGLIGDRQAAAVHFQAIGGAVTSFPWDYLDANPVQAFEKMRRQ